MPTTSNFGWTTPADTDLVKDGAAAIRTLGNGIDTSFLDLKGGTTGQVLSKASNTDLDFTWVAQDDSNAIQNAIVDAKGDLISATAADTPARLAVGSDGLYLQADSSTATGLKWATAGGDKTITEKATGSFSGSTTTISGLTDDNIMILAWNVRPSTTQQVSIRFNNNTSNLYYYVRLGQRNASSSHFNAAGSPEAAIWPGFNLTTVAEQGTVINLTNCKQAGYTFFNITSYGEDDGGVWALVSSGYFRSATQLTSVSFGITGANFTRGSWAVLGG